MLRRPVIAALCALAATAASPGAASACSLVAPTGPQSVDITVSEADAAIVGTVLSSTAPDPADPSGSVDTVVAVEQVVTGAVAGSQVTLRHATNEGLCGFTMTTGERYGVAGTPAADGSTFDGFELFDETELGQDADLDGVPVADDACPELRDPADGCAGPAEVRVVRHAPARIGRLMRGGWAVRLKSDEAATVLVELTARLGGKRRLLASFAGDLAARKGARIPLDLGVPERALVRRRTRLDARLRVVARDAGGTGSRVSRAITFR